MATDDRAAFTELFDEHRNGIHAFLLAKTSDPELARDLLQDTFLRAWHRFGEIAALEPGPRRGWLYTVARNLVIDRYRADATRRATLAASAAESRRTAALQDDAAEHLATREQLEHVQRAVLELPDDERVVLTMSAVAGMNSSQISEALEVPPGTVRYRLHRARSRLADALEVTS